MLMFARIQRRIENPVKIWNGTATVSVEAAHEMKIGHWEFPEKTV